MYDFAPHNFSRPPLPVFFFPTCGGVVRTFFFRPPITCIFFYPIVFFPCLLVFFWSVPFAQKFSSPPRSPAVLLGVYWPPPPLLFYNRLSSPFPSFRVPTLSPFAGLFSLRFSQFWIRPRLVNVFFLRWETCLTFTPSSSALPPFAPNRVSRIKNPRAIYPCPLPWFSIRILFLLSHLPFFNLWVFFGPFSALRAAWGVLFFQSFSFFLFL